MDNLQKQCGCCRRKSVYSLQRSQNAWICQTCSALCAPNSKCLAMRRRWISFRQLEGALVHRGGVDFQLPKGSSQWGLQKLADLVRMDERLSMLDASDLAHVHLKSMRRNAMYSSWLVHKTNIRRARTLLSRIPKSVVGCDAKWHEVGRACFAITSELFDSCKKWSIEGFRTQKQCQVLWHSFLVVWMILMTRR